MYRLKFCLTEPANVQVFEEKLKERGFKPETTVNKETDFFIVAVDFDTLNSASNTAHIAGSWYIKEEGFLCGIDQFVPFVDTTNEDDEPATPAEDPLPF